MAWNKGTNKSIQPAGMGSKVLSPGAPVAFTPGQVGRPYKDGWNIERAYRDGVAKITWVMRAIDAIAGNQAKLPIRLRKGSIASGKIVEKHDLLEVLNSVANVGESSFAFRYRMSSQLLMSTRGVFIEVIRNRAGKIDSLHLLPPQLTAPIPHPTKFVSGFEVEMPDGNKKIINPDDVIWIRRPHPLDPYRSITPMEAAGIAIEVEQLAKIYNRNFLINDGRPGGLLVLRGEIDPTDKEELQGRFRGNIRKAGSVSVISSDEGADFVDTGASPRDIAWAQMRSVTKEEILAAFGVPESIIGNASGRTFSNAAEEGKVFWQETMSPHLELIARSLDKLDGKFYINFNTETVPILILSKQESELHTLNEFSNGLISANEYRVVTGRDPVVSELSDALLANPSLTPIGNTEKEMAPPAAPGAEPGLPGVPGDPNAAPAQPDQAGLPIEVTQNNIPVMDSTANPEIFGDNDPNALQDVAAGAPKAVAAVETKTAEEEAERAEQGVAKWEPVIERAIEGFFVRQQRVISEKANSKKVSRALAAGTATVDMIFDDDVWNEQLSDDLRPIYSKVIIDAAESAGSDGQPDFDAVNTLVDEQISRAEKLNDTTKEDIAAALFVAANLKNEDGTASEAKEKSRFLRLAVGAIYVDAEDKRKKQIAENEAQTSYNSGTYLAGTKSVDPRGTWVTMQDDRVRHEHTVLHGKTVPLGESFIKSGVLRFPGDPLGPPDLTIGCRCKLVLVG